MSDTKQWALCSCKNNEYCDCKGKHPIVGDMAFYGVIIEIWELDCHKFTILVFKYEWVDNRNSAKLDELGFTLVDLNRMQSKSLRSS